MDLPTTFFDRLERSGSREVLAIHHAESGLAAWIVFDRPELGPAFGGIRRRDYPDQEAALDDALVLARAMTEKCALFDLPAGGAKAVLLRDRMISPERAYRELGRAIERLGGRFYTGPDVGTGPAELGFLAEETRYVTRPDGEGPGEIGRATATGVERAMGVALEELDGSARWAERTVVVQGLGDVGERLAKSLRQRGARVYGTDLDSERLERVTRDCDLAPLKPGAEYATSCDVLAPCAVGGLLNRAIVPTLAARVVCGSANNTVADVETAAALAERGVLFVPDPVASSGGLLLGASFHLEGRRPSLQAIGDAVDAVTRRILTRARADQVSPSAALRRDVDERIESRMEAKA